MSEFERLSLQLGSTLQFIKSVVTSSNKTGHLPAGHGIHAFPRAFQGSGQAELISGAAFNKASQNSKVDFWDLQEPSRGLRSSGLHR